jgi:hypothetical protein
MTLYGIIFLIILMIIFIPELIIIVGVYILFLFVMFFEFILKIFNLMFGDKENRKYETKHKNKTKTTNVPIR